MLRFNSLCLSYFYDIIDHNLRHKNNRSCLKFFLKKMIGRCCSLTHLLNGFILKKVWEVFP